MASRSGFVLQWGRSGTGEGEFGFSWGLATGPGDQVVVVAASNHRVQVFDGQGTFQRMWGWGVRTGAAQFESCSSNCQAGIAGSSAGQLDQARGLAVNAQGQVFVATSRITEFRSSTATATSLSPWGTATGADRYEICSADCRKGKPGDGDGQFSFPHAVAVDRDDGSVVVVDSVNNRLQRFRSDGTFYAIWGRGIRGVHFNNPSGTAIDSDGNVYVVEPGEHRVQKLDAVGTPLASWKSFGSGPGQFNEPHGVAVDSSGNFYVAERLNHRVQKFDPDGNLLAMWGSEGTSAGRFNVCTEIAVNSLDEVFVADSTNRIQKFKSPSE